MPIVNSYVFNIGIYILSNGYELKLLSLIKYLNIYVGFQQFLNECGIFHHKS